MFLLIDNYDSFTYNLYSLFRNLNEEVNVIKNDEFISADNYDGIVLSPGPSNPTNAGTSLDYLRKYASKIPVFGVCLGMQCVCHYLGYKIRKAETIKHGKLDTIKKSVDSVILNNVPLTFTAVRYHSLVADAADIAVGFSESDGEIMAVENLEKSLFGVQFHPESYLSTYGEDIVKNFIDYAKKRQREVSHA